MSEVMEAPPAKVSDFQRRMRNLVIGRRKTKKADTKLKNTGSSRPTNIMVVDTLEDYKSVVGDEKDQIVVVRFYATWCKACRAVAPAFYRLASIYKDVIFVEVAVTDKNANLHQGLSVPSLPFAHIYHPNGGLVEELKMSRKYFPQFARTLQAYVSGACELPDGETASPFPPTE